MKSVDQGYVEDAVYKSLSRDKWKRSLDIIRDVNQGLDMDDEIPMAQIYVALDKAEIEGWAERRSVPQASLGRRPGKRSEYRLTGGLRKDSKAKASFGSLVPRPA